MSHMFFSKLCRPGWLQSQRSACLSLLNAGIKDRATMPTLFVFNNFVGICACVDVGMAWDGPGSQRTTSESWLALSVSLLVSAALHTPD